MNTFSYAKHLQDTNKQILLENMEEDISDEMMYDKKKVPLAEAKLIQRSSW